MSWFIIICWLAATASTVALALWLTIGARVRRVARSRASVREGLNVPEPPDGRPLVSVIVPAHNEQRVIEACITSLRAQTYPNLQLIFVLDRCTDDTAAIVRRHAAADPRITIIENDTCPPDWAGKCHAAARGASEATGDLLLFTDADTRFDPDLIRAAVALAMQRDLDLLSLLSTLTTERPFERVAQPVATMTLVGMYPIERINRAERPRPFANGQFMLFRRAAYERLGGHAAVRNDLLEDIAFARRLHKSGGRGGIALADGMLRCCMYDSFAAFNAGWRRIFIEACRRKPARLRKAALRQFILGVIAPAAQLAALGLAIAAAARGDGPLAAILLGLVAAGWLVQAAALVRIYRMGGTPARAAWLYPLGCIVIGRILLTAARDLTHRRPVTWAGRQYILEPR